MTVPGGVISLPPGASTLETLENNLQNMSAPAMKARAVDRFPNIMNGSTGGSPAVDLTPFGILTNIWAGTNALVAQADPADIQGPEDLPDLLLQFIEGLPVIGQLVGLVEAILGTYDGDDQVLLTIQGIFDPIRKLMQMITGVFTGFPSVGQVELALPDFIKQPLTDLVSILVNVLDSIPIIGPPVGNALEDLANIFGLLKDKSEVAQSSANTANVGLAILTNRVNDIEAGGVSLYNTFDYDGGGAGTPTDLGPDLTVKYNDGSGAVGTSKANNGTTVWYTGGYDDRRYMARFNTPLATNKHRVSVVLNQFQYGYAGNQAHGYVILCCNDAMTEYVIGTFGGDGKAEIGVQLTTGYTRLGAPVDITTSEGDLWDGDVGFGGNPRRFRLIQNNNVRVDQTDLGHVALLDANHLFAAFGEDCAIGAGPFGTTYQIGPPNIQVVAAADF